jgi:hypothetical protein
MSAPPLRSDFKAIGPRKLARRARSVIPIRPGDSWRWPGFMMAARARMRPRLAASDEWKQNEIEIEGNLGTGGEASPSVGRHSNRHPFSALLLELAARITMGDKIVLFPRNHAPATYGEFTIRRMIPNIEFWHQSIDGRWHFKINNKGFRDETDYVYDKSPGVYRVLVLGDSHAEGFEVAQQETFSAQLKKELMRRGIKAEVLNTGVSGFGTAEELVFLENEGFRYQPDMVVVAFFGNDYSDNVRSDLYRLKNGELEVVSKVYAPGVDAIALTHRIPGLKWLGENSYGYSLVFNGIWNLLKLRSIEKAKLEFAVPVDVVSPGEIELTAALLNRLGTFCKAQGFSSILVDIPEKRGDGFETSFKGDLIARTKGSFDHILTSTTYLAGRRPDELVHVPPMATTIFRLRPTYCWRKLSPASPRKTPRDATQWSRRRQDKGWARSAGSPQAVARFRPNTGSQFSQ